MNSVVIDKNQIDENKTVLLSSEQSAHLLNIVKVQLNSTLKLTILNEGIGSAKIIEIKNNEIRVKIIEIKDGLHFPIEVIIGASRPPTLKKVIEHGSTMGVSRFHIVHCELTEKSYLQSKVLQNDQFTTLSKLGLSQSTVFYKQPEIKIYKSLNQLLSSINIDQKFILSPKVENKANFELLNINSPSIFAIGPERGWSNTEVETFKENNFKEVAISPSVLRVETALFSLMSHLNLKMI